MATIYRFIVENQMGKGSGRVNGATEKTTAKKGKAVSLFGGQRGGVEHNRKLRAINQLGNRMTGGVWEKGMRLGRAGMGLVKVNKDTGEFAGFSGPAIAIILAFLFKSIFDIQNKQRQRAETQNEQNFKALENGFGSVHSEYEISRNFWDGRITYNENK